MPEPSVTVVIPTLAADQTLGECLASLEKQSRRDFEVIVVDNGGQDNAALQLAKRTGAIIVKPGRNVGFGAAINLGYRRSRARFLATLNDDAVAHPHWLAALLAAMEARTDAGMGASQVRMLGEDRLDSAGMLMCGDGSSRQRGHGSAVGTFCQSEEVLLPSGSAAIYRRAMLEEIGLFDEDFFLYCEDTDLGLRARWAGWTCLYVADAVVDHHYSHSAGRASALKAYYVERNRLFVIAKNFPAAMLLAAPFVTMARYAWHLRWMLARRGAAARFREEEGSTLLLIWIAVRAHLVCLARCVSLWRSRRAVRRTARISSAAFRELLAAHAISARRLAEL
ncbi:MAG: glycosyltransferase family 2 protein [Candidatus Solibacter usitatus]|nr:glycosyltransferase family 2 protein [Candidatus Solibacter usitatus]